jgi:4-hydroxybenzoate polyprenyltransferase
MASVSKYFSLIKFSHTIFALPFAVIGFFIAVIQSSEPINWLLFVYVVLCMVFARSAAMAFNRYIDRDIDKRNERTAQVREIPNGSIKPMAALFLLSSIVFFLLPLLILLIRYVFICRQLLCWWCWVIV